MVRSVKHLVYTTGPRCSLVGHEEHGIRATCSMGLTLQLFPGTKLSPHPSTKHSILKENIQ